MGIWMGSDLIVQTKIHKTQALMRHCDMPGGGVMCSSRESKNPHGICMALGWPPSAPNDSNNGIIKYFSSPCEPPKSHADLQYTTS